MKEFSEELRELPTPVFLDKYPAEDDVLGWLKLKQDDFFNNHTFKGAISLIEQLQSEASSASRNIDILVSQREQLRADLAEREAEILAYRTVLHELACLGNGDKYGNSIGNELARSSLEIQQPSTSYLEQWEKDRYGEPVAWMNPKNGIPIALVKKKTDRDNIFLVPLYARKD